MIKALKDKKFLLAFFTITFPVMLQNFISFLVSFVDNIMVGGVSNEAVSSVYAVNQASFIFFVVTWGLFSGASIFVQQFYGAKDIEHLRQSFRYKLAIGTGLAVIAIPLFFIFGPSLTAFYSRSDSNQIGILAEAARYSPFIYLSFIPLVLSISYAGTMRETGKTMTPMIAGLAALLTNVVFNALFIYVFKLGVQGAAIATFMARMVEFVSIYYACRKKKEAFAINILKDFKIEKKLFRAITIKMLPLLLNEILWAGGMIMQSLSYANRENVLSALSIFSTTTEIFGIVFSGLAVGIGVMVGSTLGANKTEEAKDTVKKLIWLGILISVIVGGIMIILAPYVPLLWTEVSAGQQLLAGQMIIVYGSFLWIFSVCVSAYHVLRAGGMVFQTMVLDSGIMWLCTVPLAWALGLYTTLPLVLIYVLIQCVDILKMFVGLYLVKKGSWANNLTKGLSSEELVVAHI